MSHKKLRTEKNCLNCGHVVEDRFCSRCGQENLELDDSAFHLVVHYIQDLFHYDGKLWLTLKSLVTRPGLVSREYMEGKRKSHLEPIRFYVFASTVFFLTFFLVVGKQVDIANPDPSTNYSRRLFLLEQEKEFLKDSPDTTHVNQLINALELQSGDTSSALADTIASDLEIDFFNVDERATDSMVWLEKILIKRLEAKADEMEKKHEGDGSRALRDYADEILHTLPQLIFLSLPFFALFLKLLYWHSRRTRYVEHFIFSVYYYAYLFAMMLVYILLGWILGKLEETSVASVTGWIVLLMVLYPFIYLFLSMKRFYNDRLGTLIVRFLTLITLLMITFFLLFLLVAVITLLL